MGIDLVVVDLLVIVLLLLVDVVFFDVNCDFVEKLGFCVVEFGEGGGIGMYCVEVVLVLFGCLFVLDVFVDVVVDVVLGDYVDLWDELLKDFVCYLFIKVGDDFIDDEVMWLVE